MSPSVLRALLVPVIASVLGLVASGCQLLPARLQLPQARAESHFVDFAEAVVYAERASFVYDGDLGKAELRDDLTLGDLPASDIRYIVERGPDGTQHVAVRGTANVKNVILDSKLVPDKHPKLGVVLHRGFAEAANELYAHLLPKLDKGKPVTLTGHSLGGAVAAIIGMFLKVDGYDVTKVVTFGQPKITSSVGAAAFATLPIIRFINDDDPVADVPPSIENKDGNWRYSHFGPAVVLRGPQGYMFFEAHQAASHSIGNFFSQLGDHEVEDHKIKEYLKQLLQRAKGGIEMPAAL